MFDKSIKIDLSNYTRQVIEVKQYDDLVLNINVFNKDEAVNVEGCDVDFTVVKKDNTFIVDSNAEINGNLITINCVKDITRNSGVLVGEVKITKNGLVKSSFYITLNVIASVLDGNESVSKNVITAKEELDASISEAKAINSKVEANRITRYGANVGELIKSEILGKYICYVKVLNNAFRNNLVINRVNNYLILPCEEIEIDRVKFGALESIFVDTVPNVGLEYNFIVEVGYRE